MLVFTMVATLHEPVLRTQFKSKNVKVKQIQTELQACLGLASKLSSATIPRYIITDAQAVVAGKQRPLEQQRADGAPPSSVPASAATSTSSAQAGAAPASAAHDANHRSMAPAEPHQPQAAGAWRVPPKQQQKRQKAAEAEASKQKRQKPGAAAADPASAQEKNRRMTGKRSLPPVPGFAGPAPSAKLQAGPVGAAGGHAAPPAAVAAPSSPAPASDAGCDVEAALASLLVG